MAVQAVVTDAEEIVSALRQIPFFAPLTWGDLAALATHVEVQHYPPGARLLIEGTYGSRLLVVQRGQVLVWKRMAGTDVELARRSAVCFLGEMSLVEEGLRSASARTLTECTVLELEKRAFDSLLHDHPQIALTVIRELSNRLRVTDNRLIATLVERNDYLVQRNEALQRAQQQLERTYDATLIALMNALDLRDASTEGHSQRVVNYSLAMGRAAGLSEGELSALQRGALLHDIGKIGVPDSILLKPGKLTELERDLMRHHPMWGADILKNIEFLTDAMPVVRSHHEWFDGTGYPEGLRGHQIPLAARIFAIADTFDALTSERSYRQPLVPHEALEQIRRESGTHFDPEVVALFESIFDTIVTILSKYS